MSVSIFSVCRYPLFTRMLCYYSIIKMFKTSYNQFLMRGLSFLFFCINNCTSLQAIIDVNKLFHELMMFLLFGNVVEAFYFLNELP